MYYKLLFSFEVSILFSHDRAFLSLSHGSPPGLLSLLGQFDLSPRRNAWAFSWKGMLFFFHPFPWVSARLNLTPIFPHPQNTGYESACLSARAQSTPAKRMKYQKKQKKMRRYSTTVYFLPLRALQNIAPHLSLKFRLSKISQNETPSWVWLQNSE